MYPFLRLATTVVGALRDDKIGFDETVTITLPVTRGDVEATRMNNGRYLTLMDLGRYALTIRAGYLPILARRRWYPLVSSVMIHFKRSLRVGTTFDLATRIVCWDRRYVFLDQRFAQRGELRARGLVKAFFMGPRGPIGSADLFGAGGYDTTSPPFPASITTWQAAEAAATAEGSEA